MDWNDSALPSIVALRHLTMSGPFLSPASVLRLFSLPLESLDLEFCLVLPGDDDALISAEQPVGGGALKRLKLPNCEHGMRALQLYVRWLQRSGSPLEQLSSRCPPSPELLGFIVSHLRQLRELDLEWSIAGMYAAQTLDFSPLTTAPRLPHLTKLSLPAPRRPGLPWEQHQAFTAESQRLVSAYSAQLTSLAVTLPSLSCLIPWLRVLSACHLLSELVIKGSMEWNEPAVAGQLTAELQSAGDALSLPSIRKLQLHRLPVTDGGLLWLLGRCPELETYSLLLLPLVTEAGQEAASRSCAKLRAGQMQRAEAIS